MRFYKLQLCDMILAANGIAAPPEKDVRGQNLTQR